MLSPMLHLIIKKDGDSVLPTIILKKYLTKISSCLPYMYGNNTTHKEDII